MRYIVVLFPVCIWYFTMALTMEAKNWWLEICQQLMMTTLELMSSGLLSTFLLLPIMKDDAMIQLGARGRFINLMSHVAASKSCVVLSCRTVDWNWRSEDTWYCDKLARARDAPRFYKYFLWSILCIYSRRGRGHKIQISTYLLTQIFMREIIHVCQTFKLSHK